MPRVWEGVPELEGMPESAQSHVWFKAYHIALHRWRTWVLGLLALLAALGGLGTVGYLLGGVIGAIVGGAVGTLVGVNLLFWVTVWQARRYIRQVLDTGDWSEEPKR